MFSTLVCKNQDIWLDTTCNGYHMTFVSRWLTSLSATTSRSIHVAANDIISSPLIYLLNSSLASHHLQGPVKTYEGPHICPSVKKQQIHSDSPRGTLCKLDKVPANSRGCSFSREQSPGGISALLPPHLYPPLLWVTSARSAVQPWHKGLFKHLLVYFV